MSEHRPWTPCSECGGETAKRGRPPYLCVDCREATRRERARAAQVRFKQRHGIPLGSLDPKPCAWCGAPYEPGGYNSAYCQDVCRKAAALAKAKQRYAITKQRRARKPRVSAAELERRLNAYFEQHERAA